MDNGIPVSTYWAFTIGAIASITTILVSVLTTSEYPPTPEELQQIEDEKAQGPLLKRTLENIYTAIKEMPKTMRQLIPVMFFPGTLCSVIGSTLPRPCPYPFMIR